MGLGESRPTFYFDVHGEVNTDKTIELARERAEELGIGKVVVASETGLSALKVLDAFEGSEVIVVSSAAGTAVDGSVIGDLKIGIPDPEMMEELEGRGARVVRGTDPFWNISAHTGLVDTSKLGMKFYKIICGGLHVCMTGVLEATDAGYLVEGEDGLVRRPVGQSNAAFVAGADGADRLQHNRLGEVPR